MKRISSRMVELTDTEERAADLFYDILDEGKPINGAAWSALRAIEREGNIKFDDNFIAWLSEDTVKRGQRGTIVFKPVEPAAGISAVTGEPCC